MKKNNQLMENMKMRVIGNAIFTGITLFSAVAIGATALLNWDKVTKLSLDRMLDGGAMSSAWDYLADGEEGKLLDSREFENLFLWQKEEGFTQDASFDVRYSFASAEDPYKYRLSDSQRKEILKVTSSTQFMNSICEVAIPVAIDQLLQHETNFKEDFPGYETPDRMSIREVMASALYYQMEFVLTAIEEAKTLSAPNASILKSFEFFKRRQSEGGDPLLNAYKGCLIDFQSKLEKWSGLKSENWRKRLNQTSNR